MGTVLARATPLFYDASEGKKFSADTTLEVVECPTCGITYAIPEPLVRSAQKHHGDRNNGWKLCCPLGHTWWYCSETAVEREKRLRVNAEQRERATRDLLEYEERSHAATRGHLTRKRKQLDRIKAGVCPCCHRNFKNLARHMAGQHPEFKP